MLLVSQKQDRIMFSGALEAGCMVLESTNQINSHKTQDLSTFVSTPSLNLFGILLVTVHKTKVSNENNFVNTDILWNLHFFRRVEQNPENLHRKLSSQIVENLFSNKCSIFMHWVLFSFLVSLICSLYYVNVHEECNRLGRNPIATSDLTDPHLNAVILLAPYDIQIQRWSPRCFKNNYCSNSQIL